MKKQILTLAVLIAFGTLSINVLAQDHDHSKMDMDQSMPEVKSYDVDKVFQEQLNAVFQSNIKLNEAFMTSNQEKVGKAAQETKDMIGKVDMKLIKDQAHMDWMKYQKTMNDGLQMIIKSTSIEDQRMHFAGFNFGLYQSIKAFGVGEQAFYQFCPMANKNEGAYWLSGVKEIRNPYMGIMMPKCGSTKETLN